MVDGGKRYARCRALEETRILQLSRSNFDRLMRSGSRLAYKLLDGLNNSLVGALRGADVEVAALKSEQNRLHSEPPAVAAGDQTDSIPVLMEAPVPRMPRVEGNLRVTGDQPVPVPLIDGDIDSFIAQLEARIGGFGEEEFEVL